MSAKYEIFLGTDRQYYFRLKAPNGEKILASEGYTTKANCQNGIQSVKVNSPHDANYAHRIINLFDGKVVTENIREQFHV